MAWQLSKKEQAWALSLESDERYSYAVNKIRTYGEIWSLKSDKGWVLGKDPSGHPVFPIWPHKAFAMEAASGDWGDVYPEMIPIDDWTKISIKVLEDYKAILGVMMTPGADSMWIPVPVSDFTLHIQGPKLKKYQPVKQSPNA